jgi:hypothetical protein
LNGAKVIVPKAAEEARRLFGGFFVLILQDFPATVQNQNQHKLSALHCFRPSKIISTKDKNAKMVGAAYNTCPSCFEIVAATIVFVHDPFLY